MSKRRDQPVLDQIIEGADDREGGGPDYKDDVTGKEILGDYGPDGRVVWRDATPKPAPLDEDGPYPAAAMGEAPEAAPSMTVLATHCQINAALQALESRRKAESKRYRSEKAKLWPIAHCCSNSRRSDHRSIPPSWPDPPAPWPASHRHSSRQTHEQTHEQDRGDGVRQHPRPAPPRRRRAPEGAGDREGGSPFEEGEEIDVRSLEIDEPAPAATFLPREAWTRHRVAMATIEARERIARDRAHIKELEKLDAILAKLDPA